MSAAWTLFKTAPSLPSQFSHITTPMGNTFEKYQNDKYQLYGRTIFIVGTLLWLVVFGGITAVYLYDPDLILSLLPLIVLDFVIVYLVIGIIQAVVRVYILGRCVMVSDRQYPALQDMVRQAAAEIGLTQTPVTFIHNSSGVTNAMAVRLFGRRFVWLTSALIDHDTAAQVRFVIGHELGHHALGHLNRFKNILRAPGYIVPLLRPAYLRSRELSCDRVGAFLAHDVANSIGALQMLALGSGKLNAAMNTDAFIAQDNMVPAPSGWILHIFSAYPRLTQRAEAVADFYRAP